MHQLIMEIKMYVLLVLAVALHVSELLMMIVFPVQILIIWYSILILVLRLALILMQLVGYIV